MRRKPKLRVTTSPSEPRAGDRMTVWLELTSKSRTPVSVCKATLVVAELVNHQNAASQRAEHLRLQADFGAMVLEPGKRRLSAVFDLPGNLPPTFESFLATVEAELTVEARIPWWRDLEERFLLKIAPSGYAPRPKGARVYTTHENGAREGEATMEATLDPSALALGGTLEFALSTDPLPSRVTAALVPMGHLRANRSAGGTDLKRYEVELEKPAAPREAKTYRLGIPANAPPSMDLYLTQIRWAVSIIAKFPRKSSLELKIPVDVATLPAASKSAALPSIGEERRALVFGEVGRRLGLATDMTERLLETRVGPIDVQIRGRASGAGADAKLSWRPLGAELELRAEAWTDKLRLSRARHHEGIYVDARETAQAEPFTGSELLATLRAFPTFAVHDHEATLAIERGAERVSTLQAFVEGTLRLARLLERSLRAVPPPAKGAHALVAWKAFAGAHGAHLEVGSLSLRDVRWEETLVDVGTAWTEDAEPIETTLATDLAPGVTVEPQAVTEGAKLLPGMLVVGQRVTWTTPGLVEDPATLAEKLSQMAAARALLNGHKRLGAYR